MNKTRIVWGLGLVVVAVLLVLNLFGVSMGLPAGVSLWRVMLSAICLTAMVNELVRLRIPGAFFPLALGYYFLHEEINNMIGVQTEVSFWLLMLIALMLTVGSALLIPKRIYTESFKKQAKEFSHKTEGKTNRNNVCYIDCQGPFSEKIENNLGLSEVFFTNTDSYTGEGTVYVENNLGKVILHIPKSWYVEARVENSLGSLELPKQECGEGNQRLTLIGENNLGSLEVVYIR